MGAGSSTCVLSDREEVFKFKYLEYSSVQQAILSTWEWTDREVDWSKIGPTVWESLWRNQLAQPLALYTSLSFLSACWNVDVVTEAWAAVLELEMTLSMEVPTFCSFHRTLPQV